MRHCQDLLSRDRNAGAHWHSDAISIASPNERREYQHRLSEPVIRKCGLSALMVADIIVRVACWFLEHYVPKARINLKNRVAIRITYTLKKD
jgi:hypothetical protein